MNIFVLHESPRISAQYMCDKHIPKMCVESAQMLASALLRHGTNVSDMPLTKKGTPYKGGYQWHPCTRWAGDSKENYVWLLAHALALCEEFKWRYGKTHACYDPINHMCNMGDVLKSKGQTPFAQAMPIKYKNSCAILAYRNYYLAEKKSFATWNKGRPTPLWWITKASRRDAK